MDKKIASKEKIILPKNLQREMIKFFLRTSVPKMAAIKRQSQETIDGATDLPETRLFTQQSVLRNSSASNEAEEG